MRRHALQNHMDEHDDDPAEGDTSGCWGGGNWVVYQEWRTKSRIGHIEAHHMNDSTDVRVGRQPGSTRVTSESGEIDQGLSRYGATLSCT